MSQPFEDDEMLEILQSFLVETSELLDSLTISLMELEKDPTDTELINSIFRSFHTIKGTSSFMGLNDISHLTHQAEDLLNKIRRNELQISQDILDVLLDTRDRLEQMTDAVTEPGEPIEYEDLSERIKELSNGEAGSTATTEAKDDNANQEIATEKEEVRQENSNLNYVLENTDIFKGSGDFTEDELALIDQAFAEMNSNLQNEAEEASKNKEKQVEKPQAQKVETKSEPEATKTEPLEKKTEAPKADKAVEAADSANRRATLKNISKSLTHTETIRIDVRRVESLMDLSGELVLGRNRLSQLVGRILTEDDLKVVQSDLIETANQIDQITSEIQTSAMKMRMVPIGRLFQKAPKMVRDLSKEFNKKIELTLEGEDTEVDRGIIEELNDPLVHMLRNSCDHGIETVDERIASGKPEKGNIKLTAYHEGNHIILKITDDGRGINPEIIANKSVERGFITAEQAKTMTNWEIYQLIFRPGFSTAKTITSVSGRGVGMDVVKSNITKLKGIIEIDSKVGEGSEFIVKLPLTLAIIQGLLVRSSGNIYALPLSSVVEVVSYHQEQVHYVNNQKVIRIRDEVLPLIQLDEVTGDETSEDNESRYVVSIAVGIERIGLVCKDLLGQQEIVIKSLGNYLTNIKGIAGSTIIGDGSVIMILDTQGIINKIKERETLITA